MKPFLFVIVFFAELIEFLGGFYFFWAFFFSRKFRKEIFEKWKKNRWGGRLGMLMDALMATLIGLSPLWITLAVHYDN